MRKQWRKALGIAGVCACSWAACGSASGAGTRFSESFDHPAGGLPPEWDVVRRGSDATAEIIENAVGPGAGPRPALLIQRPGAHASNAAVFYTGSRGAIRDGKTADLTASVVMTLLRMGGSSASGILFRAQTRAYNTFQGYFVCLGGSGDDRGLGIFWNPDTHVYSSRDALAFTRIPELRPGVPYLLRVQARGGDIEASAWSLDAVGDAETKLGKVRLDRVEHRHAGYFGLRGANANSGPIGAWFFDLHVESF